MELCMAQQLCNFHETKSASVSHGLLVDSHQNVQGHTAQDSSKFSWEPLRNFLKREPEKNIPNYFVVVSRLWLVFPKVGSGEFFFRKPIAERETSKIFFGGGSNYSEHPPRAPIFPPWCKFFYLEKISKPIQSDGSSWKVVTIVIWLWGYYMLHDMGIIIMFIDTNIYKFRSCGYLDKDSKSPFTNKSGAFVVV